MKSDITLQLTMGYKFSHS